MPYRKVLIIRFVGIGRCRDDYSRGLFRMPGLS